MPKLQVLSNLRKLGLLECQCIQIVHDLIVCINSKLEEISADTVSNIDSLSIRSMVTARYVQQQTPNATMSMAGNQIDNVSNPNQAQSSQGLQTVADESNLSNETASQT